MKYFIIFTSFFFLNSCKENRNDVLYSNYLTAINNGSTFQYFLVIKLKNLNNGLEKEVCTKGSFLLGAIHRENNLGYDEISRAKVFQIATKNKDRYFEFKNDSAIASIDYEKYSVSELKQLEKTMNLDSINYKIKKYKKWSKWILDDKMMTMYAHILFNKGILTGENGCAGGTLIYSKVGI